MKNSEFQKLIRTLVQEVLDEEDIDEITTTGNAAGYNTPNAFKKTDGTDEDDESEGDHIDKANDQTGYKRVDEYHDGMSKKQIKKELEFVDRLISKANLSSKQKKDALEMKEKLSSLLSEVKLPVDWKTGKEENEYVNRWLELKKSDKTPNQKIGIGVRNIRYELQEMNKFLSWYNRIRTENSLSKDKYWKRTQRHLKKMKEQMISIVRQVQEIDSSLDEINEDK